MDVAIPALAAINCCGAAHRIRRLNGADRRHQTISRSGSISERTAWLAEPYIGIPNYTGLEMGTRESLYENSRKAWLAGFQLATHANGERAIDRTLGVYEQLQRELPRHDPRFRLEHCTVVTPESSRKTRSRGNSDSVCRLCAP